MVKRTVMQGRSVDQSDVTSKLRILHGSDSAWASIDLRQALSRFETGRIAIGRLRNWVGRWQFLLEKTGFNQGRLPVTRCNAPLLAMSWPSLKTLSPFPLP